MHTRQRVLLAPLSNVPQGRALPTLPTASPAPRPVLVPGDGGEQCERPDVVGDAGSTEQRHGERVGTLQVTHKELYGPPGARKRSQGQQELPQHGRDFSVTIF